MSIDICFLNQHLRYWNVLHFMFMFKSVSYSIRHLSNFDLTLEDSIMRFEFKNRSFCKREYINDTVMVSFYTRVWPNVKHCKTDRFMYSKSMKNSHNLNFIKMHIFLTDEFKISFLCICMRLDETMNWNLAHPSRKMCW